MASIGCTLVPPEQLRQSSEMGMSREAGWVRTLESPSVSLVQEKRESKVLVELALAVAELKRSWRKCGSGGC